MDFAARIGIAFHTVLQNLNENPPKLKELSAIAEDARERFSSELQKQEEIASERPREQTLPRNDARIERAVEAIIAEAVRMSRIGNRSTPSPYNSFGSHIDNTDRPSVSSGSADNMEPGTVEVEVAVSSSDGLLNGRLDRVEHLDDGVHIIDYKSALREELAERYARQLQLYALMWFEVRGVWPSEGYVVYPLNGATYRVSVDPESCHTTGREAKRAILNVTGNTSLSQLATPGDVCKSCEFRPWCQPFWHWQKEEISETAALRGAETGFEGSATEIKSVGTHWKVTMAWRMASIQIIAPIERFPHLKDAHEGSRLRVLDTRLKGLRHQPRAQVSGYSEIFLML